MGAELETQVHEVLALAKSFAVTEETYQLANVHLCNCKDVKAQIIEYWREKKDAAYRTWKLTCSAESDMLTPVTKAETIWADKIRIYREVQERARRAEEARLQAIAEEQSRKERAKLEAQAARAEAKGKVEIAEAKREEAAVIQAPAIVLPPVAKPQNLTVRKVWKTEIRDLAKLLAAAAAEPRFRGLVKPDVGAIRRYVQTTAGRDVPPGVIAYQEEEYAGKPRRGEGW